MLIIVAYCMVPHGRPVVERNGGKVRGLRDSLTLLLGIF